MKYQILMTLRHTILDRYLRPACDKHPAMEATQAIKMEKIYRQALKGYKKTIDCKKILTYLLALNTMWALGLLFGSQCSVDKARAWYSKALSGYEKVFRKDHHKY